ncbi:F-box domain-containing protein [Mycena venus]|uniref:F-box domain-containing protein n=1 Tax=Mycena venus TaxID=2733690 RepID=A0A8H7CFM8_9AGAR|nr:F-box domain-containing protein [Mycena venus]
MTTSCPGALRPFLRWLPRSSRISRLKSKPLAVPYELWSEIFRMLDNPELVVVSRVSRAFNAHAIPIYLALKQPDIFPALQRAVFLPPVRKLSCTVYGTKRFQIICYLASFLAQQTTLEDVYLAFNAPDPFTGFGPKQKPIPRRTVQTEICRLLNCVTPTRKTLFITANKVLISDSARGDLWSLNPAVAPPRRIQHVTILQATLAAKAGRPARPYFRVALNTLAEICGTTYRNSFVLDVLRSLHVKYSPSPDDWAVVVLNAVRAVGWSLNLTPALSAADWSHILPQLDLPHLQELSMGPHETTYSANPELHDIGIADLDAFLIRHRIIERLDYLPQLFPHPLPVSGLSLGSLRYMTRLTTTPAHFIHLHHTPNSFPALVDLILLGAASIPVAHAAADFMAVLSLLGDTTEIQAPALRLRFPGSWIAPPPKGLAVQCVRSLLIFGDFAWGVDALAEFLAPFEPGLKVVEFQPTSRSALEQTLMSGLQRRVVWLEKVLW